MFRLTLIECGESCIRYVGKGTVRQDMKPASQPGNILKSEKKVHCENKNSVFLCHKMQYTA